MSIKCPYCEFESVLLDESEQIEEMDKHVSRFHRKMLFPHKTITDIVRLHVETGTPITDLVKMFEETRNLLGNMEKSEGGF